MQALTVNNIKFELGKGFCVAVPGTHSATMQFSEIVYVGAKEADTSVKTFMTGKLVIASSQNAMWQAYSKGAAVIMVIDNKMPLPGSYRT